jgi:hypothetical protein
MSRVSSKLDGIFSEKAPVPLSISPAATSWLLLTTTRSNSSAVTL